MKRRSVEAAVYELDAKTGEPISFLCTDKRCLRKLEQFGIERVIVRLNSKVINKEQPACRNCKTPLSYC